MHTIHQALTIGRSQLAHSPTPDVDARLLLQHLLGVNHAYLIAHADDPVDDELMEAYQTAVSRAAAHEPIPYIIGTAPFFEFDLTVTPAVLIPRPETEQLVEQVAAWAQKRPLRRLVDVGTGSGCIAIALARLLPAVEITAVDLSTKALAVARHNGKRLAPGRIHWVSADLLTPLVGPFDGIVANLPYVTDSEWTRLDDGVKLHEPALALKGGADGLDLVRRLLDQAVTRLHPTGAIFLEIGWQQGTAVCELAQAVFPHATVQLHQDFAGHDRFVSVVHKMEDE